MGCLLSQKLFLAAKQGILEADKKVITIEASATQIEQ